jgi:hypothetical protein
MKTRREMIDAFLGSCGPAVLGLGVADDGLDGRAPAQLAPDGAGDGAEPRPKQIILPALPTPSAASNRLLAHDKGEGIMAQRAAQFAR